jgi:hypothetical protein
MARRMEPLRHFFLFCKKGITAGFRTGGDDPPITIDLDPTIVRTSGDGILEPAVMTGVGVVHGTICSTFLAFSIQCSHEIIPGKQRD